MIIAVRIVKKLVMSDLDNTLLPIITQEEFVKIWFRDIAKKFYEHNIEQSRGLNAMNEGSRAMILNDGTMLNAERFFGTAVPLSGCTREKLVEALTDYYADTFANVRGICRENPYAPEIARLMRAHAEHAVIATMPMFPYEAAKTRMRWVGLDADSFDYVTSFDSCSYCKPNPGFYREILERFKVEPKDALMIGNDVREDMEPCEELGIETFLVTDHMITHGLDYSRFRRGTYPELIEFLKTV